MPPLRILELAGSPYEMGYQHGRAYAEDIRKLTEERVHLCSDEAWTGRALDRAAALRLAADCAEAHEAYAPDLMRELEGMADATGLSVPELLITGGFTDFVDTIYNVDSERVEPVYANNDCTTFMVDNDATRDGFAFIGQTWDMHATATPFVILLRGRPVNAPDFLALSVTGCVGMIGMNSAGIAVGINNLMTADGQPGVTWPFVIRQVLAQTHLEDALDAIMSAPLAGGHNYVLMDKNGDGYNIEATPSVCAVEPFHGEVMAHTNRCLEPVTQPLERGLTPDLEDDSDTRLRRAVTLLSQRPLTAEGLMAITADRSDGRFSICALSEAPYFSETCGAAIMRPGTREFWGVWGLPLMNNYERFVL
ncbi:MAG: C45 family autoproteolytic acyltransferase/hydrolase [Chloroflexota bacterium]